MNEGGRHLRYWAKKTTDGLYHPVLNHCLDVAAAARMILKKRPRAVARLAATSGLPADTLLALVPLLLSFHDLGKLADGFQCLDRELMAELQGVCRPAQYDREIFRHDSVGYAQVEERLETVLADLLPEELRNPFAKTWLAAAMGHHGRPPIVDRRSRMDRLRQFPSAVAGDLDVSLAELLHLFLPAGLALPSGFDENVWYRRWRPASWQMAGVAVLADWLGSSVTFFPPNKSDFTAREYYETIALPAAERAVRACGLAEQPLTGPKSFAELWPDYQATPLQQLAAELPLAAGPQLFVIEEVTGGGKTEAAFTLAHRLIAAEEADGLYFGLPTMATANAMFDRLSLCSQHLFHPDAVPSMVLAHKKRDLRLDLLAEAARSREGDDDHAAVHCSAWLADSRKKALLAEIGVGTIDQALLGVLQARHQSLRLWGLAGKVLVVDEVHAADAYMQKLLCKLLEVHAAFGSSAILLSATLPSGHRRKLAEAFAKGRGRQVEIPAVVDYPALLHVHDGDAATYPVAARPEMSRRLGIRLLHEEAEVDALLEKTLASGGCACWIRNTVGDAVAAWQRLSARWGEDRVGLFHARFTVADRHRHEQEVLRRFGKESGPAQRAGRLLIGTQVLEQSLDLDFDAMVSDLAPIDLLIQRAGRLRRHARAADGTRITGAEQRGEAIFHLFTPPPSPEAGSNWVSGFLSGASRIYPDHGRLWAGARWLADKGELNVPEDLREVIEAVYAGDSESSFPPALATISEKFEGKQQAERSIAAANLIAFGLGYEPTGMVSNWRDDVSTPTRLGEPTVTLRLGRLDGGEVEPLHPGPSGWERSEVTVLQSRVAAEWPNDASLAARAKETMPDTGRWTLLVVLRPKDGLLRGAALGPNEAPVQITYSPACGLDSVRV